MGGWIYEKISIWTSTYEQIYWFKIRKPSSEEEFKLFEDALHKLQGNITIDDVYEICNAFCDDCEDDEVMFGIIHLIEQLEMDGYLKCIALCSPDMVGAHEWAMTLNIGI